MTSWQQAERFLARTHEVQNQPPALENYNLFAQDTALQEALKREGASWARDSVAAFGELAGQAQTIRLGFLANAYRPQFEPQDRFGHRTDLVEYHDAYHQLMALATKHGLHASPWAEPGPGAHVARACRYYLHTQVEAAHGCPITMTFAAVPALQHQPDLAAYWLPKILKNSYDPRNVPDGEKQAVTIGMAMTEKQGGSDVRANTTYAYPVGKEGPGQAYELVGHKWFVSAPMCDAFLVLAQTKAGLSCFLLPRWRPDGSKNPLQIQRLKDKMGNVANASSEAELRGALAWMVGDEGRGVRTIIEMVAMTRYDCMIGSSAGMRQATVQAVHHCHHRAAFGAQLIDQPLMQNVLADLALESEAAMTLTMRMARAMDHQHDEHERAFARIAVAVGKYWICKRTPEHAYEAMEVIGGSGVMENCIMPRLYREAPINAIWEGSGNVQCLDVLRAVAKQPDSFAAFLKELNRAKGSHANLDAAIAALPERLKTAQQQPFYARQLVELMARALQGALLQQHAPNAVADAFCSSRLGVTEHMGYGRLTDPTAARQILSRAWPA
ncbi:isovaleryl-CoA dehydrogenase [Pseudidiomarina terrestris]|uniref:isovaleryl-CoA dehydrogenase n=1 Tax=Pseudidiomarina terrestris TaxID=2820060 RepID=UPI002655865E|nr:MULTISPECIES: isovaleryl-CoA dehydrogenase [unclassified Pseudidiomarina]MDN7126211.1 isovaleryl-CoA dehydrogenase [Pseudidiomarina sp. 1APR75-33.1]MDN7134236.1 isovaleryl-CoA dehydrogenase [Pseudidiomarina sp. 1ASP75-5]MDN7137076.1 isovaleryl-CoA dehydrogenase [Pseudidiomarina sp. 1ASP75-14]